MKAMASVKRWPILSFLSVEFAEQITDVLVFGSAGNEALIRLKSGDFYALGCNSNGCLGIGEGSSALEPLKVKHLCQKGIISMAYGSGPHLLAVTVSRVELTIGENGWRSPEEPSTPTRIERMEIKLNTGELYSWGHSGYGQLGHSNAEKNIPALVTANLEGKKSVVAVACGSYHSVVLTSDGEVYTFGSNNCGQLGLGVSNSLGVPKKVAGALAGEKITSIACGQSFTVALSAGGELFSWGYNGNGQLGIGSNMNQQVPMKVCVPKTRFFEVYCGMAHVLALTDAGEIYAWGGNSYGQLGNGKTSSATFPTLINVENERWTSIAAHHYTNTSAAGSRSGKVFMWGQCHGVSILSPREVPVKTLDEVFALFGQPQVMFKPLKIKDRGENSSLRNSLRSAFDTKETSDIVFVVDKRELYVHKAILKIRCNYFRAMMQSHWDDDDKNRIEISDFSYTVFRAFLLYLYTDTVELSPEDAIGLLELANAYCEDDLKVQCERIIKRGISIDNAAALYAAALTFSAQELENYCFQYIINHMTAVTKTEAFKELAGDRVKDLVIKAADSEAFKH